MSGAIASSFPTRLFGDFQQLHANTAAQEIQNQYAPQKNALLIEQSRQTLGANEIEYMARASQSLLGLGDEGQMAAQYPAVVASLQQQGFAKNAPPQFPGVAALQRIAAMGTSSEKLGEQRGVTGAVNAYGSTIGLNGSSTPGVASTPGATTPAALAIPPRGTGGPGSSASVPLEWIQYYREASAETGIPMDLLIAQHRQESGFNPKARGAAGEIGLGQIKPSTARDPGYGLTGVDPATLDDPRNNILFSARYLKARGGQGTDWNNPAAQAQALAAYNGGGDPNYVQNVNRYRPGLSPTDPARQVTTYQPQVAPEQQPGAPGGGRVQVASVTPTVATDATTTAPAPGVTPPVPGQQQTAATTPPAPQQQPQPAATLPPQLQTNAAGLTPQDVAELRVMQGAARTPADLQRFQNEVQQRQVANRALQQNWRTEQRQATTDQRVADRQAKEDVRHAETDARAARAEQRAEDKARREADDAGQPFPGTSETAAANRTMRVLRPKILDGTATEEERADYALATSHYTKPGPPQWMADPNDPTKQVLASVPGEIPEGFPAPGFRPGGATEAGSGGGRGPRVIPGTSKTTPMTEGQAAAASFADRMQVAVPIMQDLDNVSTYKERGLERAGNYIGYNLNSPEYQRLRTAQEAFLAGVLRKESGAAVSPSEWERYAKLYFPMPGDDATTIKMKQQFRETTMQGMIREAGSGYKPAAKAPDQAPSKADPEEGRTATGPGGKKLIRRNGKWEPI